MTTAPTVPAPAESPRTGAATRRRRAGRVDDDTRRINWWATAFIAVCSLTVLIPLYLAVVVALKTPEQVASGTGFELPWPIRWDNFAEAWERAGFSTALVNTGLIAVGSVVFTLLTSSLVSYAIARNMHRPFFKGVFFYLLAALFIPFPIIMLPLVKQTSLLGLDNQAGLIVLYTIYGLSLNIFIYTAFIRSIPIELEEAARVDGASTWRVFWQVVFPLLAPMNATVGILTCVWAWNDFIMPLVVLTDPGSRTLPLAQYVFQGQYNTDYPVAFASYLMAMAPLLLVYVFSQRWVISGSRAGRSSDVRRPPGGGRRGYGGSMGSRGESGKGPDRRLGLTPERVIDVALELSRGSGLNSWTVRDLAAELDVAPSVIYHHIGGRDLVVRGVVERLLDRMSPPDPALDWQDWFRTFLTEVRPPLLAFPGVAKWLVMHGPSFPGAKAFFDAGIATLVRAGFERPALVYSLLMNSAMLTISMGDDRLEPGEDGPRDHTSMLRSFAPLQHESIGIDQLISEVLGPLAEDPERAGRAVNATYYALLVDALLTGLSAQLP